MKEDEEYLEELKGYLKKWKKGETPKKKVEKKEKKEDKSKEDKKKKKDESSSEEEKDKRPLPKSQEACEKKIDGTHVWLYRFVLTASFEGENKED